MGKLLLAQILKGDIISEKFKKETCNLYEDWI